MDKTTQQIISAYMAEIGRKGGQSKLKKYGREYFSRIGKIGATSKWAMAKKSKELSNP